MKKLIYLWTLVLFLAGSVVSAQIPGSDVAPKKEKKSDLSAPCPIDSKVRIGKLNNGMTYYIRANQKPENRVQFRLVVNAGSILEDDDQQGLAHFCEHMAFNGTKYYRGNEMNSELQKRGIVFGLGINAWTSFDETVYYVELPSDTAELLEMGFKILDGWAGGLLFQGDEIEKERGVILEEWRGGLGAGERLRKATWPVMLKGSLYAERLPIGLESIIKNFKHEAIKRFYADWYRPDLQAVVIVGDINVDEMEAKVKEYFGAYAKRENPRERKSFGVPDNKEPLIALATDKEATGTALQFFWKHPKAPQGTIGNYREMLVRNLVSGMLTGRLGEIGEKPDAPYVYAYGGYSGFLGRSTDAFFCGSMPKENQIEATMIVLLTEIIRADKHGFLQTELDRQKEEILNNYRKSAKEEKNTQNVRFAQEYTNNYLDGEVIPGIRQEYRYAKEFLPNITLEEVNALISGWVTDENFVVYLTAPEKEGYKVPTKAEIEKIISDMKNIQPEPYEDTYKEAPLLDKELADVKILSTKKNDVLDYTEYTLPNGVRFVVKKTDFKEDEVLVQAFSFGGNSQYEDADLLTATYTASIVNQSGVGNFNNTDLGKKLKGANLSIVPNISGLTEGFSGNCSPKDFETLLQLVYLYFDAPRKDQEAFDRVMSQKKTQYKFLGANPQIALVKKLFETAYPDNKRTIILPTEEQLDAVSLDRVYEIYTDRFKDASDFTFFFVGNVTDSMIQLMSRYLGNLPSTGRKENWIDRSTPIVGGVVRETVYKGMDNSGILVMLGEKEGFDATPKNKLAILMLGDAVQITATEVIREKMGGTYSPSTSVDYEILPKPSVSWQFYINCNPKKAGEIEKTAMKIMESYVKNGPDEETLNKVKEQMIRSRETKLKENSFWMGVLHGSYLYNLNRDDLYQYEQQVREMTAADIQAVAQKYIDLSQHVTVMLKPEKK